ncbi:hypothetical protein A3D05_04580 [Candidatus Gottesmanbacteria bacterium RIFCSPHIGHO2_02_FULL_40_24]|uniref:Membrane protein 6-pyruvoyl-tetrahydropterin synthase-related domain-containing protein n=1 Tax=Candidatus Gottesmanbacteria bacterium RIFCSPHIGHO2_01_FULL_40_15 TaxID=1798376 RepID=A0A1F5Z2M3_9BACT|nr:MAG: hypothetical protein A2777_05610 [Candidatus Gottesmanbacteria bacterium RIFCSPHIGHO2_01_FULL_40_15]OGG16146.1 MAG: hypothetical protein A3D05_04580 [Candidatus Gottesmanbacteria bacterium RIFCSPHIGHO2_02_FULL_40_24]OGG21468.1 MAG: hypothetical protein A3B48_04575 [Candidatus Gottesmanbacteria bacterium RIFCSPLOWO2_01_FULL_40_10]OGG25816.1 MAG: hypothetical protein A3E42_05850 [Candidatus Gottesmanbacteria bacterium RIFCSPHIGHO2_12_FULL_40_13]
MNLYKKHFFLILFCTVVTFFYFPFFLYGKLPVAADTIVGMYHPFRDNIWDGFRAGVPFKNYLITDPVRQQYVWRELAVDQMKKGQLPVWNPYSFSGTPLLANIQASAFYPLNILFFFLPFSLAWSWQIIISAFLAGIFMYLYLRNKNISPPASFIGAISFSFSGFAVSWLTWNTILHTAAFLPLSLFTADNIFLRTRPLKLHLAVFILSLVFAFLAGHLQIFFYSMILIIANILFNLRTLKKNKFSYLLLFGLSFLIFILITLPQSIPLFRLIFESARDIDQGVWRKVGWFIPWQNLVQFLVPDFFGNPATGNYFGIWNYMEFVGYIGVIPLLLSLFSLVFIRSQLTLFFGSVLIISLLFAFPTPVARLVYIFNIPLISTAQPTRLLFLVDFSLSVLAAYGLNSLKDFKKFRKMTIIALIIFFVFIILWLLVSLPFAEPLFFDEGLRSISRRNLILPGFIFTAGALSLMGFIKKQYKASRKIFIFVILLLTVADLMRFAWKFTPFSNRNWLYPQTKITDILKRDTSKWRFMSLDRRIMPPNFSIAYRFEDAGGYDPLYLKDYNLLVSSWNQGKSAVEASPFNRIVTPQISDSIITDILNVKYLLSYGPLSSTKLNLTAAEGMTYLYENKNVFPRAWLTPFLIKVSNQAQVLEKIFELKDFLKTITVTSEAVDFKNTINALPAVIPPGNSPKDRADLVLWSENSITVRTFSEKTQILVLSEIYHPSWKVKINGKKGKIYKVNYLLRGIPLEEGENLVEMSATVF